MAGEPSASGALRGYYAKLSRPLPAAPAGPTLAAHTEMTRIAIGSCAQQDRPMAFWDTIAKDRPQLFLMIGDNVYGDTRWQGQADLPPLRAAYERLARRDEFRRFRSAVPMMTTWDDHDLGLNDGGGNFAFKEYAEKIYEHFWSSPADVRSRPGVYQSAIYGPAGKRVQAIMLDTRFFRSDLAARPYQEPAPALGWYVANTAPGATLLGQSQWRWLAAELAKPADVRLVISSIQVLTEAHGFEKWGNFPAERQRLLDMLGQAGNAVLLSGDRHRAGVYHDRATGLWELTSSSLNLSFGGNSAEPDPARTQGLYSDENYAVLDFDWAARAVKMSLRKSADGSVIGTEQSVPMRAAR